MCFVSACLFISKLSCACGCVPTGQNSRSEWPSQEESQEASLSRPATASQFGRSSYRCSALCVFLILLLVPLPSTAPSAPKCQLGSPQIALGLRHFFCRSEATLLIAFPDVCQSEATSTSGHPSCAVAWHWLDSASGSFAEGGCFCG